jgi:hypothetical protein
LLMDDEEAVCFVCGRSDCAQLPLISAEPSNEGDFLYIQICEHCLDKDYKRTAAITPDELADLLEMLRNVRDEGDG